MRTRPLLVSGRVFTADSDEPWASAVVVEHDRITYVGPLEAAPVDPTTCHVVDAGRGVILPGFVDAHSHLLMTGQSLAKAQLRTARELDDIGRALIDWGRAHPDAPRVLGTGWTYSAVPGGRPTAAMLDRFVSDRPVYVEANDLHSSWVNTPALAELGIDRGTPDPIGGEIVRDAQGEATGHLLETASMELVWPLLGRIDDGTRDEHLATAVGAYLSAGVTTVVDMALDSAACAAIERAEQAGELPLRVIAHWLIRRTGDPASEADQIEEAAAVAARHQSDRFRIVGIKLITDGTIDGCTAAMIDPYHDGSNAAPVWDAESLRAVVRRAHDRRLQVAIHAIGDRAVRTALDAIEAAVGGDRGHRHRIEHLEYVDRADTARLGELGVVASMQPVHVDPAIMDNWVTMLGDHRVDRGFAWPEYRHGGAVLAFSTDSPTAPYQPLPNMYIATTRRSPSDPTLAPHRPDFAVTLADAITHATRDAAWASKGEGSFGSLRAGLSGDIVVLDRDPFHEGCGVLPEIRPIVTISGGAIVHDAR